MKYLIYLSTAVRLLDEQAINNILVKSRARNAANGVTGLLLYHDGNFIQLIEGDAGAVDITLARISKDPLHKNITVIDEGKSTGRLFADWSMGYKQATKQEYDGFTDPNKLQDKAADHPALTMLKTFVETNLA